MTQTRLTAYTPNGAALGVLPAPSSLSAAYPLNDVGALSLEYALDGPRSDLLGQPLEVALETSADRGATWTEPESSRFLYLRDGRDPVKRDAYQVECPAYITRLAKAVVPFTGLDATGSRTFAAQTAGAILHTLFTEAQARGALTGLTWTFNASTDSAGVAWPTSLQRTISYEPGRDFLAILQEFAALGDVDYRTQGRAVHLFIGNTTTGMAPDRTTGTSPVSLRFGRDLTEAPFRRTWEGLADTVLVGGDGAVSVTRTNTGALKPWGRQETYVPAAGVTDTGTLNVIGDASLTLSSDVRVEHTFGLDFNAATFLPFRDYTPGAWVWKATDGTAPVRMRVRQITLTRDASGVTAGNVVLNDRFLESDVATARKIQAILTGVAGGDTGSPAPVGNDILAPAQVGLVTGSSTTYLEGSKVLAQISLDWPDVTTNADATVATDVDHYEVQYRKGSAGGFAQLTTVGASALSWSPFPINTLFQFQVRAVDTVGNAGAWSAVASVTTGSDATPPSPPSTPVLTTRLGVTRAVWDGKNNVAGAMEADTSYVEVHASASSGFTPSTTTLQGYIQGAGYVLLSGQTYDALVYVKFVAVDTSGNKSTPSAQASILVKAVAAADFTARVIQAAHIELGSLTGDVISGDAIDGKTVTAPIIRTTATPNRGILLSNGGTDRYGNNLPPAGFYTYNSSGVSTFSVDAATGNVAMLGAVTSTLFRTNDGTGTGQRIEIDSSKSRTWIRFINNVAGEYVPSGFGTDVPGISTDATGSSQYLTLQSPQYSAYLHKAQLLLQTYSTGGSWARLQADGGGNVTLSSIGGEVQVTNGVFRVTNGGAGMVVAGGGATITGGITVSTGGASITGTVTATDWAKAGTRSQNIAALNTRYTQAVTFGAAFPSSGPIPRVTCSPQVTNGDQVFATPTAVTRSGFTMNIVRTAGTLGNVDIDWTALGIP